MKVWLSLYMMEWVKSSPLCSISLSFSTWEGTLSGVARICCSMRAPAVTLVASSSNIWKNLVSRGTKRTMGAPCTPATRGTTAWFAWAHQYLTGEKERQTSRKRGGRLREFWSGVDEDMRENKEGHPRGVAWESATRVIKGW